ncbi:hypothetical protein STSP2_00982 [Anaerohalosphaera lusitana]|uniref:Uncharacterized protein n=1 Tax=Anaerohalosphaera lusitana TaxID=1936003 RepID=A0A1U9NIT4_9BACT|nr:hypothetical protein [Anaerohalosphaera lusitana]AQT67831.1 hypothetical protein STSP2_00982 [Anaerohalosphaera lusitana]
MSKNRSFVPSDFSLRHVPLFIVVCIIMSVICILLGLALQTLPEFWRGLLFGVALSQIVTLTWLFPHKKIDINSLPQPSAEVRAKCNDPNCSFVEAVKLYREETGSSLSEAAAVLKAYRAERNTKD